jgi:hypothetical protein
VSDPLEPGQAGEPPFHVLHDGETGSSAPDPAPARSRGRPPGSKNKPRKRVRVRTTPTEPTVSQVDRKLTESLEFLLLSPAEVSRGIGFAFGAAHFSETAKPTARKIVQASHDFDELRALLTNAEKMVSGKMLLAAALIAYLLPPIAALTGREGIAYLLSPVSPEQVAAIDALLSDRELAARVQQMRADGLDDDQVAAILNGNGQGQQPGAAPGRSAAQPPGTTPTN